MILSSMVILTALVAGADEKKWEPAGKRDGITVFSRPKEGSDVLEMKAIGLIDGPPQEVFNVLWDWAGYNTTMPYTEESKVVRLENDGKVTVFYSVINAPLVAKRDYLIRVTNSSDWKDGKGFMKSEWTAIVDPKIPERDGYVRTKTNDGWWLLEPREDGKKTFATYWVYTDPGGSIPKFIVNRANGSAVPDVFAAIRKAVSEKRAKGGAAAPK